MFFFLQNEHILDSFVNNSETENLIMDLICWVPLLVGEIGKP